MNYAIAPLTCRPWTLNGISAQLIASHYENDYGSAVLRLNEVSREIAALDSAQVVPAILHRLKRDELELLNSTLLHELYFASLGGDGRAIPPALETIITRDFGSVSRCRDQFTTLAAALSGKSGWVILSFVPRNHSLVLHSSAGHEQALAGAVPLLALDMFEHAYHLEFGANATAYIAAFMRNIDWEAVLRRYNEASAPPPAGTNSDSSGPPSMSPEEVRSMLESGESVHVIDVRPRHYVTRSTEIVDGAEWRDPERVQDWIAEVPRDKPVVTFCAYGFHIGCETAAALREAGIDARFMAGGHSAWKAMKGRVRNRD